MKIVFFGDSFTSGENNGNISFTDYISSEFDICNFGISGTTIGEYSIYPVDGNSLLGNIGKHKNIISTADVICLEYGINDTTSVLCGFATQQQVVISFVKAVDWIRQINPNAKIIFLSLSDDKQVIYEYAQLQVKYLTDDYFNGYDFYIPSNLWFTTYLEIIKEISKKCKIINMYINAYSLDHLSSDNIHPDDYGYQIIAGNIEGQLNRYI